jgi:hypothetical protein
LSFIFGYPLTPAIRGGFANFIAKHEGRCATWNLDAPPDFRDMAPRSVNQPGKRADSGSRSYFQDDSAACHCIAADDMVKQGPTDCIEF